MIMDSQLNSFYNNYQSVNSTTAPSPGQDEPSLDYVSLFNYKDPSIEFTSLNPPLNPQSDAAVAFPGNYTTSSSTNPPEEEEAGSPDDSESDAVLRYISQVLMEENIDLNPSMFHDPLSLQAAEKPFYDVLGEKYPSSPNQHPLILLDHHYSLSPEENVSGSAGYSAGGSGALSTDNTCTGTANSSGSGMSGSVDSNWVLGPENGNISPFVQPRPAQPMTTTFTSPLPPFTTSSTTLDSSSVSGNHTLFGNNSIHFNIFSDKDSMIQFQRGVEEASKFLPKASNLLVDLDDIIYPEESKKETANVVVVKTEKDERSSSRGRKVHYLDDTDLTEGEESRRNKQSALSIDETDELSELFDKVLLCTGKREDGCMRDTQLNKTESLQSNEADQKDSRANNRPDGGGVGGDKGTTTADLRTLLILCAQAAASDDWKTADELLKQIRHHSSPVGDGSQRLAHFFAAALEARLSGTGSQIYTALGSKRNTASEMIKAYQLFVSCSPFKKISMIFANLTILKLAEKRDKLHIIDFGILYGFQWPILIQKLSEREGGPPQLKITGVELPQPGFRPAERVQATGQRLAKYCEKFNVPFKYHAIAQKWETIKISDLDIEGDEVVAVNCSHRMKNLLDETIVVDSPRNAVLKLIRDIKPNLFVQGIINGSFNAPFFISRFREALFYYSTLFDVLDTNVSREHPERIMYEREFYGRQIINVVACEGTERVERPETYKQWQTRNRRAGFRQMKLDEELVKKLRDKVKRFYHKDFLIDVDGNWVLQGWKGRITFAVSAWTPCY